MRVERHVFGSVRGYGTLAHSAGLTEADCRRLGCLSFGTPYDSTYPSSLNERIAYWSRPLDSSRRAVTRVLPGKPDDAGRPTLLFVTCVVDVEDWNFIVQGNAPALLRVGELWSWNGEPRLPPLEIADPVPGSWGFEADGVRRILGLISLVEMSWQSEQPLIVRSDQYRLTEVAAVERLLPPSLRKRYSAVYRSLNPELPATLNCIAAGTPLGSSAATRFLAEAAAPYARELEQEGFGDGHEPSILLVGYGRFGRGDSGAGTRPAEDPKMKLHVGGAGRHPRRGAAPVSTAVLVMCLLLVFLIGGAAGWLLGSSGGDKAKAIDNAWAECLKRAIELPMQGREQQLQSMEEIRQILDAPILAASGTQPEVMDGLTRSEGAVRLLKQVEDQIARIEPSSPSAVQEAERAVVLLEKEGIGAAEPLRDWMQARRRPHEDRYPAVADRLREQIGLELTSLSATGDRVDTRALAQARELRYALDLLDRTIEDRQETWIRDSLTQLDSLLTTWREKLDSVERLSQAMQASEAGRQQEQIEALAARLQELRELLTTAPGPPRRQAAVESLRRMARDGRIPWGELFGEAIDALAEWLQALIDVTHPEQLAELRKTAETCEILARNLESAANQWNDQKTLKETTELLRSIRMETRTLAETARNLTKLADGLVKP